MSEFANKLIAWQEQHGRHDLPWQNTRDPYRVWLSEIMLQQTQVAAVLGYYERFLHRFPDVAALAAASLDDVLALWSGLGYYSRARNLHRCAQDVVGRFGGAFPAPVYAAHAGQTYPELIARMADGETVEPHVGDFVAGRTFTRYFWQVELDEQLQPTGRDIVTPPGPPAPR